MAIITYNDLVNIIQNKSNNYFDRKSFSKDVILEEDMRKLIDEYDAYETQILRILGLYARTANVYMMSPTIIHFILNRLSVFHDCYCKKGFRKGNSLSEAEIVILPKEYTRHWLSILNANNAFVIPYGVVFDISDEDIYNNMTTMFFHKIIKSNYKLNFVSYKAGNSIIEKYYLKYIPESQKFDFLINMFINSRTDTCLSYPLFKNIFDSIGFTDEQKKLLANAIHSRISLSEYIDASDFRFSKTYIRYISKYNGKIRIKTTDVSILKKVISRGLTDDDIFECFDILDIMVLLKTPNAPDSVVIKFIEKNPDCLSIVSASAMSLIFNRRDVFKLYGAQAFNNMMKTAIRGIIPGNMIKHFDNGLINIDTSLNIDTDAICLYEELHDE